ncbi:MAG: hypothetical protein N2C12_17425, partial [Planctomycetales bacterium]
MKLVIDYIVYLIARFVFSVVQMLPVTACISLARPILWIAFDVLKIRADVVDDNLRHAFPDMTPAERKRMAQRHWEPLV